MSYHLSSFVETALDRDSRPVLSAFWLAVNEQIIQKTPAPNLVSYAFGECPAPLSEHQIGSRWYPVDAKLASFEKVDRSLPSAHWFVVSDYMENVG